MISVLKLNSGNINSITNMMSYIGYPNYKIINTKEEIFNAKKIIMPGVGHFGETMRYLNNNDLSNTLNFIIKEKKVPILGICVGAQIMLESSEEDDQEQGLKFLEGKCKKFELDSKRVSLNMGWNKIIIKKENNLYENNDNKFYFCHSYYMDEVNQKNILSKTIFGKEFISSFQKENILGVQFHIEKSHKYGMSFLKNFIQNFYV